MKTNAIALRVGIGGHALHGGFGMTSRMWGTTLDTITEMEVVLASGRVVKANKYNNKDLFWVCTSGKTIP